MRRAYAGRGTPGTGPICGGSFGEGLFVLVAVNDLAESPAKFRLGLA